MQVDVTPEAAQQLKAEIGDGGLFQLIYDSEGCGCAVSGVPALWKIGNAPDDAVVAVRLSNSVEIIYEPRHEVFFEDRLKLDYVPERRAFKLSSDSQIYHHALRPVDRSRTG